MRPFRTGLAENFNREKECVTFNRIVQRSCTEAPFICHDRLSYPNPLQASPLPIPHKALRRSSEVTHHLPPTRLKTHLPMQFNASTDKGFFHENKHQVNKKLNQFAEQCIHSKIMHRELVYLTSANISVPAKTKQ
jgi:hypothetical protein